MCSGRHSMRSAEQRCPALLNADVSVSRTTCSGSAELSTIIALTPPVSAISAASGPARAASAELIARAVSTEPVNATPATRGSFSSASPSVRPSPGRNCSAPGGIPACSSSATARAATSVPCSAGFAMHRVAGRERRSDLTREDREREIPRADAEEHAAPDELELVALAGRSRQRHRRRQHALGLGGVIAQQIDGLADLGEAVGDRLAGLGDATRDELGAVRLHEVGCAPQQRGALLGPGLAPARRERACGSQRSARRRGVCKLGEAYHAAAIGRIATFLLRAGNVDAVDTRPRTPAADGARAEPRRERLDVAQRSEVRAARVLALGPVQRSRQRDARMRDRRQRACDLDGIGDDFVDCAQRRPRAGSRTTCSRRSRAAAARDTAASARDCRPARTRGSGARSPAARAARRRAPRPCRATVAARTAARRPRRAATRRYARCASRTAGRARCAPSATPWRTRDTRHRCCTYA